VQPQRAAADRLSAETRDEQQAGQGHHVGRVQRTTPLAVEAALEAGVDLREVLLEA
jgi:hypothetical protein